MDCQESPYHVTNSTLPNPFELRDSFRKKDASFRTLPGFEEYASMAWSLSRKLATATQPSIGSLI